MLYKDQIDNNRIPAHIAIIMDGNGRWAKQQGQPRSFGHQAGAETVHIIAEESAKLGVKYLTLYTFSTENWNRPVDEVSALMALLMDSIEEETFNFVSKVYCQSFSTIMKKTSDDFIMGIPLMFSRYFEKDKITDGLVPLDSTYFGEYRGTAFNESISHSQIVDFMVNKKKKEKIYSFYIKLCEELSNMGF
jgi:hypothetical protein